MIIDGLKDSDKYYFQYAAIVYYDDLYNCDFGYRDGDGTNTPKKTSQCTFRKVQSDILI